MTCYASNNAHVWVRSLSSQMSIQKIHRKTFDKLRIIYALLKNELKQLLAWISSCYNENLCYKQSFCIIIRHYSSTCTKMLNNSDYNAWTMLTLHTVYFLSRKCSFNKEVARWNLFFSISHAVSPQLTCYSSNNIVNCPSFWKFGAINPDCG